MGKLYGGITERLLRLTHARDYRKFDVSSTYCAIVSLQPIPYLEKFYRSSPAPITSTSTQDKNTLISLPIDALKTVLNASLTLDLPRILKLAKPVMHDEKSLLADLIRKLELTENNPFFAILMAIAMDGKTMGTVFSQTSIFVGLMSSLWRGEFDIDTLLGDWAPVKKAAEALKEYYSTFNQNGLDHERLILNLLKDEGLHKFLMSTNLDDQNLCHHMIEICVASRIPGLELDNMKKLLEILTSLQKVVQSNSTKIKNYQSLWTYPLLHEKGKGEFTALVLELLSLLERFQLVIDAYLKPMVIPQDILSSPLIQQAFKESKNELKPYTIKKNNLVYIDFERFIEQVIRAQNEILGIIPTPTANHLRAKQYRGLTFIAPKEESTEISIILCTFQNLYLNGFGFTECIFDNISFQNTFLENCHFEQSTFRGEIQLDGMVIDFQTAKSLFTALDQALVNGTVFTGKILLIGDKPQGENDLAIPAYLFHYHIAKATRVNWLCQTHTHFAPAFAQHDVIVEDADDELDTNIPHPQPNNSWLMGGISSLAQSAIDICRTASEKTATYLSKATEHLSTVVNLSPTEYRQSVEDDVSKEITAIQKKIAKLKRSVAAANQNNEAQQAEIEKLKMQQGEISRITASLKEKQAFKARVNKFLDKYAEYPQVQAFYNSFLANLSGSFLALFLLQNSLGLIKAKPGTISAKKKQGSNINSSVSSEIGSSTNLAKDVLGLLPTIATTAPQSIPQATNFLQEISSHIPFINGAVTFDLTPKLIEKIAYYLAFVVTHAYVEQIKLLTQKGARSFAECGVNRIVIGLLNGQMSQYQEHGIGTASLVTLRLSSVSQNRKKLFGIEIPWTHAPLDAHQSLKVTENQLYKYCGVCYVDSDRSIQQYINKDKKREWSRKLNFMRISQTEFDIFRANLMNAITPENNEYETNEVSLDHTEPGILPIGNSLPTLQQFETMQKRLAAMEQLLGLLSINTLTQAQFNDSLPQEKKDEDARLIAQISSVLKSTKPPIARRAQPIETASTPFTQQSLRNRAQSISTLGDGNCAFNAVAIGLSQLILQDKLSNEQVQLLRTVLNLDDITLKEWLAQIPRWETRQQNLAPVLRKLAIAEIRKKDDVIGSLYKARLWQAYCEKSAEDDTFIVHPHIAVKFSEPNLAKEDLDIWWDVEGKDQYLDNLSLSQQVSEVPDRARWGSDIEIEFLALLFGINIRYVKNGHSHPLGIGSGTILKLTAPEKKRLGRFNLVETKVVIGFLLPKILKVTSLTNKRY